MEIEFVSQEGLVSGEWELVVRVEGSVANVTFRVDDGAAGPMAHKGDDIFTATVNTTNFEDGVHSVTVLVNRNDGSYVYAGKGIDIDNTPPNLKVRWDPVRNVTGDLAIDVSVRDVHLDGTLVNLVISNDQGRVFPIPSAGVPGEYRIVLDTRELENRTHQMHVIASDGAGNINTSEAREFRVRNHPDLTLRWFDRYDDPVEVQRTYIITFEVSNKGSVAVDGFAVGFYRNDSLFESIVYNQSLGPNESVRLTMNWTPRIVTNRATWRVYVDHENVIEELSETNNEVSQSIRVTTSNNGGCASAMFVMGVLLPGIVLTTNKGRADKRNGR